MDYFFLGNPNDFVDDGYWRVVPCGPSNDDVLTTPKFERFVPIAFPAAHAIAIVVIIILICAECQRQLESVPDG